MITGNAAGHSFVNGLCSCGREWVDIMHCTRAEVGQEGIAHTGKLNTSEADQIVAMKAKQDRIMSDSLGWTKPEAKAE